MKSSLLEVFWRNRLPKTFSKFQEKKSEKFYSKVELAFNYFEDHLPVAILQQYQNKFHC